MAGESLSARGERWSALVGSAAAQVVQMRAVAESRRESQIVAESRRSSQSQSQLPSALRQDGQGLVTDKMRTGA